MKVDVVSVEEAARILDCSEWTVRNLIRTQVITTAFVRASDGHTGNPGYGMYLDEIEHLKETRKNKARKKSKRNGKEDIKLLVEEMQA